MENFVQWRRLGCCLCVWTYFFRPYRFVNRFYFLKNNKEQMVTEFNRVDYSYNILNEIMD